MLKVMMIFYEPHPSGQSAHVLTLAQGLNRNNYSVTIVLPEDLQYSIRAFRDADVSVIPLPLRKLLWRRRAIETLFQLIHRQDFDIVHVHSQEAGLLARVVARLAGARVVVYTPQTIDIWRTRWYWLYRLVERFLSHFTGVIISVNEADQNRIIQWGIPANKVVTIPNGIDLRLFEAPVNVGRLRRSCGIDEDRKLIMQVGRLSEQKNPLAFIEGAAHVIKEHPNVIFALVGDGPLWDKMAAQIRKLGLEGKVYLLGWQDKAYRLIAAADIVSLTSRWEGAPYALLEAMAWARPVVATAVNGCPEIVQHGVTGFLVPPDDVVAWAKCVIYLLNDPGKAISMGQRGRKLVEEKYSLDKMILRIQQLYDGLVA